ncbi:MAG: hypothetical protein SVG88_06035 [Halobacteriales archaeon]|nr:hypothetical protein [Halobacteriales archaeon]
MELRTATIRGMNSPTAAREVETLLSDVNGVVRASANHDTETVEVLVTETVQTEQLKDAISAFQE